ncbi:MAG: hypothetical protein QXL29_08010 [Zestosphaera sp.]
MFELVYAYVRYVLLALVLVMLIPATALWSETLKVNVSVNVTRADLDIGSWRVFVNYTCGVCRGIEEGYVSLSEDYDTIIIYLDDEKTRNVWVGLVIENNYGVPATLKGFRVSFSDYSGTYELGEDNYRVYPYEPVKQGVGNMPYWGQLRCEDLPIEYYLTELPITINTGWKAVVWINVSTYGMNNGNLTIKLAYDTGTN